jgi:hypothetical protein
MIDIHGKARNPRAVSDVAAWCIGDRSGPPRGFAAIRRTTLPVGQGPDRVLTPSNCMALPGSRAKAMSSPLWSSVRVCDRSAREWGAATLPPQSPDAGSVCRGVS